LKEGFLGYQPLEKLLPKANHSVYKLVKLASKRAVELADGAPKLIEAPSFLKTTTIALDEIASGKVILKEVAENFPKANKKSPVSQKKEDAEKEEKVEQTQSV